MKNIITKILFVICICSANNLSAQSVVEKIIQEHHSYETPQILAIQIDQGSKAYLNWLDSQTETTGK